MSRWGKIIWSFWARFFQKTQVKKRIFTTWFKPLYIWNYMSHCEWFIDGEKKLFLWIYEFRKKFQYLIKRMPGGEGGGDTAQRDLSACVEKHFNHFELVKKLTENSIRQNYKPINIVDKPVSINQIINYTLLMFVGIFLESFKNLRTKTYKLLLLTWNLWEIFYSLFILISRPQRAKRSIILIKMQLRTLFPTILWWHFTHPWT